MQTFTKEEHQKFQKYFSIEKDPGIWDEIYLKKAQKYIPLLAKIPGILFVWVGNSTSMNAGSQESDIDLFIISQKNRLWTVRILTTLLFAFLGERKTQNNHAGKFCLSFFVDTAGMNFEHFAEKNDIYLSFWIVYLKPLLNINSTYESFLMINKRWTDLSLYEDILQANKKFLVIEKNNPKVPWFFGNILEKILKKIFLPKTLKHFEKLQKPYGIRITNHVLKFHDNDIRKGLYEKILSK